jgi:hypothetical protein
LWFLIQVLQATAEWFAPFAGGGIAWWAHIGGFIGGVVFAALVLPPRRRQWPRDADRGIPGFALSEIV